MFIDQYPLKRRNSQFEQDLVSELRKNGNTPIPLVLLDVAFSGQQSTHYFVKMNGIKEVVAFLNRHGYLAYSRRLKTKVSDVQKRVVPLTMLYHTRQQAEDAFKSIKSDIEKCLVKEIEFLNEKLIENQKMSV